MQSNISGIFDQNKTKKPRDIMSATIAKEVMKTVSKLVLLKKKKKSLFCFVNQHQRINTNVITEAWGTPSINLEDTKEEHTHTKRWFESLTGGTTTPIFQNWKITQGILLGCDGQTALGLGSFLYNLVCSFFHSFEYYDSRLLYLGIRYY